MDVLGVVPARQGSRRLPRKNLAVLGGRTLVRRALETCVASGAFHALVLSSEGEDILSQAALLPQVTPIRRPAGLAADDAHTLDVVQHAMERMERRRGQPFDAVAVVQCTAPFTAPADITAVIDHLERSGAGSVVSVQRIEAHQHPLKLKRMDGDRLLPWLEDDAMAPSQDLPVLFARNGAIYATRRDVVETGALLAPDTRGVVMPPERSIDIDTPLDLAFAEFLLSHEQSL